MEFLESSEEKKDDKSKGTIPFDFPVKPTIPPPPLTIAESKPLVTNPNAPKGYYIIAYRLSSEKNGKNRYVVTDHQDIQSFIHNRLAFGERTYDIKIIEQVPDYLNALSIADILTIEENHGLDLNRFRLGGMLMASYTWKEMIDPKTKLKKYDI